MPLDASSMKSEIGSRISFCSSFQMGSNMFVGKHDLDTLSIWTGSSVFVRTNLIIMMLITCKITKTPQVIASGSHQMNASPQNVTLVVVWSKNEKITYRYL